MLKLTKNKTVKLLRKGHHLTCLQPEKLAALLGLEQSSLPPLQVPALVLWFTQFSANNTLRQQRTKWHHSLKIKNKTCAQSSVLWHFSEQM